MAETHIDDAIVHHLESLGYLVDVACKMISKTGDGCRRVPIWIDDESVVVVDMAGHHNRLVKLDDTNAITKLEEALSELIGG